MTAAWLSYVPRNVAEDILRHSGESPIGREQRFDAIALFADVSGFTAMSEALAESGRAGTEELTTILNSYFGPMIELIESYSGIIGKFGGDAMTILFPYSPGAEAAPTRRAIQCALKMQANMHHYESIPTTVGSFRLAMKAGLAMGPIICTTVGDHSVRLEYVIAGSVLDLCAAAEHHAASGEVVVHCRLLQFAGEADIVEKRGDFALVHKLRFPAQTKRLHRLEMLPQPSIATFAAFLHPAIAQRVASGQSGFINEHRKVTILFVRFDGFDYDGDPEVSARLQQYLQAVIFTIARYDGYLNKVDMGDKGSKYIVLFGAPVAHENDEERALRCALELCALPGATARIGVNTGVVYCGQVGAEDRQEYTVMGDPVNLAARLMQAAPPGRILVSHFTYSRVAGDFTWEYLDPINVKGKAEPVPVRIVQSIVAQGAIHLLEPVYLLPMVGRELELQRALAAIGRIREGWGQILGITGEAGMGKSRLNAEIVKLATEHGLAVYTGACQSYGTSIRYLVWHTIWQEFFGIDPSASTEVQVSHLEAELTRIDPKLVQRMPLLGLALNISIPDNDLTRSLDAQMRAELLRSLLLQCLRHRSQTTSILLVVEDAHWLDPLSGDLLEYIGRNIFDLPILLVGLYRPHEAEHGLLQRMAQFAHASEIRLSELTPDEVQRLVALKLDQVWGSRDGIPPMLVERITTRAQGNPFFIEEMINFIRDHGIDPEDATALETIDLPDSLQSLIISRIDQLGEDEKTTIKVASVIGRLFKASWLWGSYPQIGTPEQVVQYLQTLMRLELTPLDKSEPELEYLFKHITTQEVAYDSLAFAFRAALHDNVGRFVEQTYSDNLDRHLDVLAFHFGRSRNLDKQRLYFRRAGDAAKTSYANQTAIEYYRRLLPLLPESEQSDIVRELGEVLQLIGKWPDAEEMYRRALRQAVPNTAQAARCQNVLGALLTFTQSYEEALLWLGRARVGFEQLNDHGGLSRTLENLSTAYFRQDNYQQSLACAKEQLRIATMSGDKGGISASEMNTGLVYWRQGDFERALEHLRRALDVATALDQKQRVIYAAGNMASVYGQQGDYVRALSYLQQALSLSTQIGYLQVSAAMIGTAGNLYGDHGQTSLALTCYQRAVQILTELGAWTNILPNLANLALELIVQHRYDVAERVNSRAIALAHELGAPYVLCGLLQDKSDLLTRLERFAEAQPINQEAFRLAGEVGRKEKQFLAQVLAIRLRVALDQTDTATAIDELNALRDIWAEENEQAAIQYTIWRLDGAQEIARQTAAKAYRTLYERTQNIEYRQRYTELTGELLPEQPPLPPLPDSVMGDPVDLKVLLERVGVVIE